MWENFEEPEQGHMVKSIWVKTEAETKAVQTT